MSCAVADAALRKRRAIVTASLEYSHVAPPFGWDNITGTVDAHTGAVFYTNTYTGDAAWTLPEYSFEESHHARTIQVHIRPVDCAGFGLVYVSGIVKRIQTGILTGLFDWYIDW
jgi:hypothetical protein